MKLTSRYSLTKTIADTLLIYNPDSGGLFWKSTGKEAGYRDPSGYIQIRIGGLLFLAHRLAFLIITGLWPSADIDHINGDKHDNRWANLRQATRTQNNLNRKNRKLPQSGFVGVYLHRASGRWHARLRIDGFETSLGYFDSATEAGETRISAAKKLYGEFYSD